MGAGRVQEAAALVVSLPRRRHTIAALLHASSCSRNDTVGAAAPSAVQPTGGGGQGQARRSALRPSVPASAAVRPSGAVYAVPWSSAALRWWLCDSPITRPAASGVEAARVPKAVMRRHAQRRERGSDSNAKATETEEAEGTERTHEERSQRCHGATDREQIASRPHGSGSDCDQTGQQKQRHMIQP